MILDTLQYKFALHKRRFDVGYGVTSYIFKLVAVFGLTSELLKETFIILLFYSIACYFLGWFWMHSKLMDAEAEVRNQYDPFMKEMRAASGAAIKRKI